MKRQKENSQENITLSEIGKQNMQSKRSIGYLQVNKLSEDRGQCHISQHSFSAFALVTEMDPQKDGGKLCL